MEIIKNLKRAEMLAERFQPVIYQEWKSIKDFPTSLIFDEEKTMESNLIWAISDPSLYYRMSEDEDYFYAFYMVFHPFDWSASQISFIRKWDSHTYDTESFCIRKSKIYNTYDIATVYHHSVKRLYGSVYLPAILIAAESHCISPYPLTGNPPKNKYSVYTSGNCKLVNIDTIGEIQYKQIKKIINSKGVDMPEQQAEHGYMFLHPDKIFKRSR